MITAARIRRLPQVVADAIAAGEVIERPASVVKELMENAIDARATRITVDVDGGGLVRIQVVDDGGGIAAADLELAVTRHATSKIGSAQDLQAITSLGFRGEALASIAAVADVRIVSRCAGADASSIRTRGGELIEEATVAAPLGTRVEVCELFATTPARLRFLKATSTESAAALRVAADLALCHPAVGITARCDERVTLRSPGGSLRDALRAVLGSRAERDLVDVDEPGAIAVGGAISAPHSHRGVRSGLVLVVNSRRVHNRTLQAAVDEAYRGLLPAGRHPFGVLALRLDPAAIDVNVHPTKREVRFLDDRAVFSAVQRTCWNALRQAPAGVMQLAAAATRDDDGGSLTLQDAGSGALPALLALGQAAGAWLVAAAGDGLVVVDPHAAHEKILYARLLESWGTRASPDSQLLLMPVVVDCDPARFDAWVRNRELVERCGFAIEEFGAGMLRCTGVPPAGSAADPGRLVGDLLDTLAGSAGPDAEARHRLAALVACHGAVRFGDRLDPDAQQRLLDELRVTPGGLRCPHGRPTVLLLDDPLLRRAFLRPPR